ncbi:MAG: hypothetical protein CL609_11380 [Anaerolineaceae bacterium]|nr:hypothetical protein [Anaerolineaceae bacterium]
MLTIETFDPSSRSEMNAFINFPFSLYQDIPQWVPQIRVDIRTMINPKKHPFYQHSDVVPFLAKKDGKVVGRIVAMENHLYNQVHQKKQANFSLLETIDDITVLEALINAVSDWAIKRGLNELVGPKPFGLGEGYGILVEGFEHRQMMTMMNYNQAYLPKLLEKLGFEKVVDFVSCMIEVDQFNLPEKVRRVADRVIEKGTIRVQSFQTRNDLKRLGKEIGQLYNEVFVNNWEYYPYTDQEITAAVDNVIMFADPGLIKVLWGGDKVIGFLFAFPDVSRILQRYQGRLHPLSIVELMRESKRTEWVSVNGMGILEDYYGRGGNALLYSEMEKTVKSRGFKYAEFTQVAETTQQMRNDLITLGGKEYKNHRVYKKALV